MQQLESIHIWKKHFNRSSDQGRYEDPILIFLNLLTNLLIQMKII